MTPELQRVAADQVETEAEQGRSGAEADARAWLERR